MPEQVTSKPSRRKKGFERASGLVQTRVRKASETRGFAQTRLLTHWAEIAGESVAKMARPVKISFTRDSLGATLTLLAPGSVAPMLQAELPKIRDRVNACYGYAAIERIRITQTAPTGFAEPQASFAPAPGQTTRITPEVEAAVKRDVGDVGDEKLRSALEALGRNIISRAGGQETPKK